MKRTTRKTRAKPQGVRPLSRRLLVEGMTDVSERLDRLMEVAKAIQQANRPNGEHVGLEYDLRTMFGLLLESQRESIRDIAGVARIYARRDDA